MDCKRRLAYRILDWPTSNVDMDPWAATVGTAVHAWLADAFRADNARLGRTRWVVEAPLEIRPGLPGSCDLYDLDERRVIDHKVVGETTIRSVKRDGPPDQYKVQAQLYGLGWDLLGLPPNEVALAFYPSGGYLGGLYVWPTPYDRDAALAALEELDWLIVAIDLLAIERNAEQFGQIKPSPSYKCAWCPWFSPRAHNFTEGCRGHLAVQEEQRSSDRKPTS